MLASQHRPVLSSSLMSETSFYNALVMVWLGLAAVVFITLRLTPGPYRRFSHRGWDPQLRP